MTLVLLSMPSVGFMNYDMNIFHNAQGHLHHTILYNGLSFQKAVELLTLHLLL